MLDTNTCDKVEGNINLTLLYFLHLNYDYETWKYNLHDSQSMTKWNDSLYDPIAKNVFGIGSNHNMTTCLRAALHYSQWMWPWKCEVPENQSKVISCRFEIEYA